MVGHYPSSLSPSLPLLPVTLPFKAAKHFSLKNSLSQKGCGFTGVIVLPVGALEMGHLGVETKHCGREDTIHSHEQLWGEQIPSHANDNHS